MKRNWVVMAMAAALTAAPAAAQTPQTQPPATTAQPSQPQPTSQASSADEHLRAASAALNDVQVANLSARAKTQVNELKRRVTALERAGASQSSASATGQAARNPKATASRVNWGTEVAAMDKILTSLLGAESAATGTTGTTGSTKSKAATAVELDDASRAKLTEFRTHLTAYAAAMGGGSTSAVPAATSDPTATPPSGTTPTTAQPPTPTSAPPAGAQPPAGATTGTTPQTGTAQSPTASTPAAGQPDMDAAKKHLTEARNSLSALTQLPAAGQLAGEARTQVSQLITNFNELITTQSNWRDSYAKVNANMTALLGADTAAVAAATGTAGAVGTSGSSGVTIDPTIREKLVEMRKHLAEFEKAAGGGSAANTAAANVEDPPTSAPTTPPATSTPATSSSTVTSASGTTGTTAATGTSGTTTSSTDAQRPAQADWMRHVAAIEAMLKSQDESGGVTLDKAKVEMLRTHLAELRKLMERR